MQFSTYSDNNFISILKKIINILTFKRNDLPYDYTKLLNQLYGAYKFKLNDLTKLKVKIVIYKVI